MPVNQRRFKTEQGFESPGFVVDNDGDLAAKSILVEETINTPIINVDSINIGGKPLYSNNGTALSANVISSSLRQLGTLDQLVVDGDTYIRYQGSNKLSVVDGTIYINSNSRGTIDNVDIGTNTAGIVTTTRLNIVDSNGAPGQIDSPNSSINFNNSTISGTVVFADSPRAPAPTSGDQLTRKDYVDNLGIAYAVVFGA